MWRDYRPFIFSVTIWHKNDCACIKMKGLINSASMHAHGKAYFQSHKCLLVSLTGPQTMDPHKHIVMHLDCY